LSVRDNFWPMAVGKNPALHFQGYVNSVLTVVMMACMLIIFFAAGRRWLLVLRGRLPQSTLAET
jgi:hypothetical protein